MKVFVPKPVFPDLQQKQTPTSLQPEQRDPQGSVAEAADVPANAADDARAGAALGMMQ